jgi:hypothetical protein
MTRTLVFSRGGRPLRDGEFDNASANVVYTGEIYDCVVRWWIGSLLSNHIVPSVSFSTVY